MTSRDDLAESGRPPGAPRGPQCSEHLKRTCAPAVQPPMDAPWGVCAVERQYRDRQASGARPFDSAEGRFELKLAWFAGVDWGSEKHQVCVLDAAGEGARRTRVRAQRYRAVANGELGAVARDGRRRRSRSGGRDATRAGGRKPDGARLRRPLDQPETARPFPRPPLAGGARRTTGGTRECSPRRCVPTRTVCGGWSRPTRQSSSCASGRV